MSESMKLRGDVPRGTALCVYGNNRLEAADCRDQGRLCLVGFAPTSCLEGDELPGCVSTGTLIGILNDSIGGELFYLGPTGIPVRFNDIPPGAWIVPVGFALNESDLWVRLGYPSGRKVN